MNWLPAYYISCLRTCLFVSGLTVYYAYEKKIQVRTTAYHAIHLKFDINEPDVVNCTFIFLFVVLIVQGLPSLRLDGAL
jgi:hypothetical protein